MTVIVNQHFRDGRCWRAYETNCKQIIGLQFYGTFFKLTFIFSYVSNFIKSDIICLINLITDIYFIQENHGILFSNNHPHRYKSIHKSACQFLLNYNFRVTKNVEFQCVILNFIFHYHNYHHHSIVIQDVGNIYSCKWYTMLFHYYSFIYKKERKSQNFNIHFFIRKKENHRILIFISL